MKYVLMIVFSLILGTLVFVFGWFGTDEKAIEVTAPPVVEEQIDEEEAKAQAEADARYEAMKAEYKKLEKARRNLDRKLARLKAIMWNVQLPAERSEQITNDMRKGYELLKAKKLLGAFSSLEGIQEELTQVEYTNKNLEGIVEEVRAIKAAKGAK